MKYFRPILSGTLTTLAPFFPLAFWPGIVGKFMYFLPVTLIITLFASLFVAYIINPVFAVSFMKHEYDEKGSSKLDARNMKKLMLSIIIILGLAIIFYAAGSFGMGNFAIFCIILNISYRFFIKRAVLSFQNKNLALAEETI